MEEKCIAQIAEMINNQIKTGISILIYHSWSITGKVVTVYKNMPTLGLLVNGLLHKGWVYISLDEGRDCYIVTLLSKNVADIIKVCDEVYCEELGFVIDSLVERKEEWTDEEYERKCKESYIKENEC